MIRQVNINDAKAIAGIYNHYITETTVSFETEPLSIDQMAKRISSLYPSFPYLVYEHNGSITGYCYVHPWKNRAAYSGTMETSIYISPSFQDKGIGRDMMAELIDMCRKQGFRILIACITAENTKSIEFHKKIGFKQVSHFEKVGYKFGRLLDVIDMQYSL